MDRNSFAVSRYIRHGLMLMPLAFLTLFFFYPLISILLVSLAPEGELDLSGFARLVTTGYYRETLGFTLGQALLSTLLTLVLALPGAYVFARYQFPGRSLFLALGVLPFVLPTLVVAAAFSALIGPRGLLNTLLMTAFALDTPPIQLDRTLAIILIVHVFYNYAIALRIITGFWLNQNPRIEEAARILGAQGWRVWWHIRLPLLRPAILAAGVLIFVFAFTSFGVVLILGGPRFATLEVEIYRQAANLFNLPMAAALALVQLIVMFIMMLVYTALQRRTAIDLVRASTVLRTPNTVREKLIVYGNLALMTLMLFLPLAALIIQSFNSGSNGFTFQHYQQLNLNPRGSVLFVPPARAILNSLAFALVTMLLSVLLGLITAYILASRASRMSRWLDPLFMLPLATSAVTLGFGYIIALDEPPLNLRASPILIPLAHTLVAMPFVVRSVLPGIRSIPPQMRESARVLGASLWRVWRLIELPLISRGLFVGATFAFTVSMGEFGATAFIARPDTPTIPIVIFRLMGQPGAMNYGQALAMSVILMSVSGLSFLLIERFRASGVGEF